MNICPFCLKGCDKRYYDTHLSTHLENSCTARFILPEPGSPESIVSWDGNGSNYKKQLEKPDVLVFDLEALAAVESFYDAPLAHSDTSKTTVHSLHQPCSFTLWHCNISDSPERPPRHTRYHGPDTITELIKQLMRCQADILQARKDNPFRKFDFKSMTKQMWREYDAETTCGICLDRQHEGFEVMSTWDKALWKAYLDARAEKKSLTKAKWIEQRLKTGSAWTEAQYLDFFERHNWSPCLHHCHVTGKKICKAHSKCNFDHTADHAPIPVLAHNANYDWKLVMAEMQALTPKDKIKVIALSGEKFMSWTWNGFQFLDLYRYRANSQADIVSKMPEEQLWRTRAFVAELIADPSLDEHMLVRRREEGFQLLKRKGVRCHEYLTDWDVFDEPELPPISKFHSKISGPCSPEDYAHALEVFKFFDCKKIRDYDLLYGDGDGAQLCDAVAAFRGSYLKNTDTPLDPLWFLGLPGLAQKKAWFRRERDRAARVLAIRADPSLKPLPDMQLLTSNQADMYCMVMKGKRGGPVAVTERVVDCNNPYMGDRYDPDKEDKTAAIVDANALYQSVMMNKLPVGNYGWEPVERHQSLLDAVPSMSKDADRGYFFEVDIHLPWWLHDKLDDYPGLNSIRPGVASPYMKANYPHQAAHKAHSKLIQDLEPKTAYVIHYQELQTALSIGWIVTKVHRVLGFDQDDFLRSTMVLNAAARKAARAAGNEFLALLFKDDSNINFGKMLEDVLKRCDATLALSGMQLNRLEHSNRFRRCTEITPSIALVHMAPQEARITSMVPAGIATLGMAKAHMTKFIYAMKDRFAGQVKIVYGDTDSVFMVFTGLDPYVALTQEPELRKYFDCSAFDKDSPFYNADNEGEPGLFKFEYAALVIMTFIGIKPKAYALALLKNPRMSRDALLQHVLADEVKKAKGGSKHATKTSTVLDDFRRCVLDPKKPIVRDVTGIVSKNCQTATVTVNRQIACGYEDKRWWTDAVHSRAHGHWRNQVEVEMDAAMEWGT
jgi:hypothetical protein